jgi:hypothetical protein
MNDTTDQSQAPPPPPPWAPIEAAMRRRPFASHPAFPLLLLLAEYGWMADKARHENNDDEFTMFSALTDRVRGLINEFHPDMVSEVAQPARPRITGEQIISFIAMHDLVRSEAPAVFAWKPHAAEQLEAFVHDQLSKPR